MLELLRTAIDAVEGLGIPVGQVSTARQQQAKSLELRAAISLSRLWQRQGRQIEALHCLQSIYAWFTEGFDTDDLQATKELLAELQ